MTELPHFHGLSFRRYLIMHYRLSYLALLGAMTFGVIGVSQAQVHDQGAMSVPPHTIPYVEWAYFGGKGFATGPENYALSGSEPVPAPLPESANAPAGHQYTFSEYLYFTGRGFASGTQ